MFPAIRLSDTKAAAYLAKITDFPYSKVVEIYPGDVEGLIACGLVNGKIALTSFLNPANNKEIGEGFYSLNNERVLCN